MFAQIPDLFTFRLADLRWARFLGPLPVLGRVALIATYSDGARHLHVFHGAQAETIAHEFEKLSAQLSQ